MTSWLSPPVHGRGEKQGFERPKGTRGGISEIAPLSVSLALPFAAPRLTPPHPAVNGGGHRHSPRLITAFQTYPPLPLTGVICVSGDVMTPGGRQVMNMRIAVGAIALAMFSGAWVQRNNRIATVWVQLGDE